MAWGRRKTRKNFTPGQVRMMEKSEDLKCHAMILEAGVAATFKTFGEWLSPNQAEITIEVLREAVQLRKQADHLMEQINKYRGETVRKRKPRRR